jgi:hypothetical protein
VVDIGRWVVSLQLKNKSTGLLVDNNVNSSREMSPVRKKQDALLISSKGNLEGRGRSEHLSPLSSFHLSHIHKTNKQNVLLILGISVFDVGEGRVNQSRAQVEGIHKKLYPCSCTWSAST